MGRRMGVLDGKAPGVALFAACKGSLCCTRISVLTITFTASEVTSYMICQRPTADDPHNLLDELPCSEVCTL